MFVFLLRPVIEDWLKRVSYFGISMNVSCAALARSIAALSQSSSQSIQSNELRRIPLLCIIYMCLQRNQLTVCMCWFVFVRAWQRTVQFLFIYFLFYFLIRNEIKMVVSMRSWCTGLLSIVYIYFRLLTAALAAQHQFEKMNFEKPGEA